MGKIGVIMQQSKRNINSINVFVHFLIDNSQEFVSKLDCMHKKWFNYKNFSTYLLLIIHY